MTDGETADDSATDDNSGSSDESGNTDAGASATAGGITASAGSITATYAEADGERRLVFEDDGRTATIAQNVEGYAMLKVRPTPDGDELERYYGFDVALDHAAELLGVPRGALPVPDAAADMGM